MRKFVLLIGVLALCAPFIGAQSGEQMFRITTLQDESDLNETPMAPPVAPPVLTVAVNGPIVTISWATLPDATSYTLRAGLAPGQTIFQQAVGNVSSVTVSAPGLGTYYVRAFATNAEGSGPISAEATITVTSMTPLPAAPTNLAASLNGRTVFFSWTNGAYATSNFIEAGTTPGASDFASAALGASPSLTVGNFPVGTLYVRVRSRNAAGQSAPSNEVTVVMPTGGACTAPATPALTASAYSTYVTLNWTAVPGAARYDLVGGTAPGASQFSFPFGGNQTGHFTGGAPLGTYYLRLVATNTCGATAVSSEVTLVVDGSAGSGPRTPDPTSNQCGRFHTGPERPCVPPPNRLSVVSRLASQYPGEFQGSCGNDNFLFRLVQELRKEDSRWGMNWKRAVIGDYSRDVITWHWGTGPDERSYDVHVIDFIANHCGGTHSPSWQDHTDLGTRGAMWTLEPYLQRGYPPNPR